MSDLIGNPGLPARRSPTATARKVTLRTVADHMGLSITTISRALKNGPEVNIETRVAVAAVAATLGYRPHLAGINLRTGKTYAVGVFVPVERPGESNMLATSLIEGLSSHLSSMGYRTTVLPVLRHEESLDAVRNLVGDGVVDGVVLKNTEPNDERVRFLLDAGIPFVTFGRTELERPHAYFDVDHERIGGEAAEILFDAGHVHPVLVAPPAHLTYSRQFVKGWRDAHLRRGQGFSETSIRFTAETPDNGREIAHSLLSHARQVTGVFIASEESAMGFVSGLASRGLRVGEDFSVITYGGSNLHSFIVPPLSGFIYSHFHTGTRVGEFLLHAIDGADPSTLQEVAKVGFVDFGSQFLHRP